MSHARQQIREAFVASLSGISVPATESRILRFSTLPAVSVYTTEEASEMISRGTYDRTCLVVVEARVEGADIDDALDDLAVEIETAMSNDATGCIRYESTEIEFEADAEKPFGLMRITYAVGYTTTASDPETIRG